MELRTAMNRLLIEGIVIVSTAPLFARHNRRCGSDRSRLADGVAFWGPAGDPSYGSCLYRPNSLAGDALAQTEIRQKGITRRGGGSRRISAQGHSQPSCRGPCKQP